MVPLEMGWRQQLFENWPVDPDLLDAHLPAALDPVANVETDTLLAADGFRRPDTEPVRYYSPGLDVVASQSKRAAGEA